MVKVKICGNTNIKDAEAALRFGADYLGFIFTESKRKVELPAAKEIIRELKDFNHFVGVFYNQPKTDVERIAGELNLSYLQFHGDETALYCQSFEEKGFRVIKTFRIKDAMSMKRIDEYRVSAFLFDTFSKEEKGGTGSAFDWNLIEDKPYVHDQLFLAGGLNVENLKAAITKIRPYAVDVASGVEARPGEKDHVLLEKFISIAKQGAGKNAKK